MHITTPIHPPFCHPAHLSRSRGFSKTHINLRNLYLFPLAIRSGNHCSCTYDWDVHFPGRDAQVPVLAVATVAEHCVPSTNGGGTAMTHMPPVWCDFSFAI